MVGRDAGHRGVDDAGVAASSGPRTNALSSERTGKLAGNERNRARGGDLLEAVAGEGAAPSVLRQSL